MKISFYGTDRDEYEAVHRGIAYEKVKENVERLLKIKKANLYLIAI